MNVFHIFRFFLKSIYMLHSRVHANSHELYYFYATKQEYHSVPCTYTPPHTHPSHTHTQKAFCGWEVNVIDRYTHEWSSSPAFPHSLSAHSFISLLKVCHGWTSTSFAVKERRRARGGGGPRRISAFIPKPFLLHYCCHSLRNFKLKKY